ncbi:MAG: hypothetical protein HY828_11365 [Actinobacteria bacterium]|nr:hypothetical protein [Actinomycetota bacterium]
MRRPQFQSTFARAVVPVAAGIAFFALAGLLLWGVAAFIAGNSDETSQNLAPTVQELGSATLLADIIASDGPIVLQDLIGNDSHVVLHHSGDDALQGWGVHLAHPVDRTFECTIEVVKGTQTFTDCEGRTLTVDDLATVPADVLGPIVNTDEGTITLDLTRR